MQIQLPKWLEEVEETQREPEKMRFLLRLAALYVDPKGRLSELSKGCGLAEGTLATLSQRDAPLSPEIVLKLETAVGRDILPRELLRPDLFVVQQ